MATGIARHGAAQLKLRVMRAFRDGRAFTATSKPRGDRRKRNLIDGEVCRLRDVHELLMDTGLGAKAYAIIEQGKIGLILSSRPADRRQLIEEAAGITKYKSRRRSAELKLEAAQQNLTRVDDIVFEVDRQRGALKRQAAKARRYRKLREELRRWEKVLFARRYRELAGSIESARTRLADARERETAAAARVAEVEADLSRLRIEQAEADRRASGIRNRRPRSQVAAGGNSSSSIVSRRPRWSRGRRRLRRKSATSRPGANRRESRSRRATRRVPTPSVRATRRQRFSLRRVTHIRVPTSRLKDSKATSKRRVARCFPR
jgi:chromosome segregation ATPase